MAINSAANTKVYIGPTTAAADATAYAALSWTEIKEVESLPAFGDSASTINFTALADARVRKRKGARDAGQLAFNCAHDPLDPGQLAAIAAEQTKSAYAFKVVLEDSADANDTDSIFYFHALVSECKTVPGAVNDIIKRAIKLDIDTAVIAVLSTAVA